MVMECRVNLPRREAGSFARDPIVPRAMVVVCGRTAAIAVKDDALGHAMIALFKAAEKCAASVFVKPPPVDDLIEIRFARVE